MGDNCGAQPGGGDEAVAQRGASREQQTRGLSLDGAAGSAEARSWRQEPSEDTLQRAFSVLMERMELEPEGAVLAYHACAPWRRELEARGFDSKTVQLCSALAGGMESGRLVQIAYLRLNASSGEDERTRYMEACKFLGSWGWEGSLHAWLQAASQEPDASFLSRGASSTAQCLGLQLLQWAGKPQTERCSLPGRSRRVNSVAFSHDGRLVISGSDDMLVTIWVTETGAEVSSFAGVR
jgi:hypothetical protein